MRRDELADLLWPEDFIDSTRLRLRQELSRLRKGLGTHDELIETTSESVTLDRSLVQNDLERLTNARSLSPNDLIVMLTEPFLPGWDDPWVTAKRDEVDQLRVRTAISSATDLLEQNEPDLAIQVLQAAKTISPKDEALRDLTMKAHSALGSLSDALGEFRRFSKPADPEESSSQSKKGIIDGSLDPDKLQALELPQAPHPIDQFFGRKQLVSELREIVRSRPETRLISLVGTGGIGKTRLVIEALKGIDIYQGFVSFVECPADDSPEAYLLQILMPGNNDPEPLNSIKRLLQDTACLLVLDNLEHLSDPGRFVASLLSSVSDLRLVVTSRKPMKVAGEHAVRVTPLEKGSEATPMLAELTGSKRTDAHRSILYEEIAEMCGGIPLTLRLAAARLRLLEPKELIEELKESTTLLRAELPDLEERHRDLNRMLRLSISSLSAEDATTLLNISFFPGGVTRAIARRMVGSDVDEVLERLLDSALIWLDDDVTPLRFRLLEPIRQFIQEESGDEPISAAKKNLIDQMMVVAEPLCDCWNIVCDTQDSIYLNERENFRQALRIALGFDPDKAAFLFQKTWTFELPVGQVSELDDISNRLEVAQLSNHRALG
ncbi:MAG: NB-ARC domain-containing protein, partial [Armatimonadota bacterium]